MAADCSAEAAVIRSYNSERLFRREIMFLEIRAIPHSLALTHADTALILQHARKTRDSTSAAQSPQQVIMAEAVESHFAQYESVSVRPKI